MTNPTPAHSDDEILERHLDLLIEEALGAPSSSDHAPPAPANHGAGPRGWLVAAACVVLGLVAVVATSVTTDDPTSLAQGKPLGPEVVVTSLAAIRALPADTDNVRLGLYTPEAVQGLFRLRELRRLDLSFETHDEPNPDRPKFFPAAAKALGHLSSLEDLDLSGHEVRGIEPLATLSRLRRLRFYYCRMDPSSLAVLKHFHNLEELTLDCVQPLDGTNFLDMQHPDHGIHAVLTSRKLHNLHLTCCRIDAAGLRAIAQRPLRKLNVYRLSKTQLAGNEFVPVDPSGYLALATIESLEDLTFSCYINEEVLRAFRKLPRLRRLNLDSTVGLRGAAVGDALAALPSVRELNLDGTDIDTAALLRLTRSRTVTHLGLGGDNDCTDDVLAAVSKMDQLHSLDVALFHKVTNVGIAHLSSMKLRRFTLLEGRQVTAKGLLQLPRSIQKLGLDIRVCSRAIFDRLHDVDDLRLRCWAHSTAEPIRQVFASPLRQRLRKLALRYDVGAPDSIELLTKFPNLQAVHAYECSTDFPMDIVSQLKQRGVAVTLPSRQEARARASAGR